MDEFCQIKKKCQASSIKYTNSKKPFRVFR